MATPCPANWGMINPKSLVSHIQCPNTDLYVEFIVHVGIAIDPERRRVYWTDEDRDVIEVANLDGSGRQVIVQSSLNEPRGIVVDIQTG